MSKEVCCTCATRLADTKVPYSTESEKPICFDRLLDCCGRTICASCQYENARFQSYCPFCQIASGSNPLPDAGLRLPPEYENIAKRVGDRENEQPPAYSTASGLGSNEPPATVDVVHFLSETDSMLSISLAYQVPVAVLRAHNGVYSDGLLAARKWLLIPRTHYQGPSLSSPPDPAEEERKNKVRRWMVATKCPDYDIACLYLKGSGYDLEIAVEAFRDDERWEKEHPMKGKNVPQNRFTSSGLTGQL